MAAPQIDPRLAEQAVAALAQYGSQSAAATALGIPRGTLQSRLIAARRFNLSPATPEVHGRRHFDVDTGYVIVGSDAHYIPGKASTAHRAFVKLIQELKPVAVVMNGDAFDGGTISRYPRIGWDEKPTVAQELEAVSVRLAEIEQAARHHNLFWPLGNHCARMESFLAANAPQFQGVKGFTLKDHFPSWLPCWSLWINNHIVIKHRLTSGVHATYLNTLKSGKTTVTGHLHSLNVRRYSDYNGHRFGIDCGTLAVPYGPQFADYTEDGNVDWCSGFVVLRFKNGQLLWPTVVSVVDEAEGVVNWGVETFSV